MSHLAPSSLLLITLLTPSFGFGQDSTDVDPGEAPGPESGSKVDEGEDAADGILRPKRLTVETGLTWVCQVFYVCTDEEGEELTSEMVEGEHPKKDVAMSLAKSECDLATCGEGTKHCCKDDDPEEPCTDPPECEQGETEVVLETWTFKGLQYRTRSISRNRYEFYGIGMDNKPIMAVRSSPSAARERFDRLALIHGGVKVNSIRARVVPTVFYKCYVRVTSRYEGTRYSREVEGVGDSQPNAAEAAINAAHIVRDQLKDAGHKRTRVVDPPRFVAITNSPHIICKPSIWREYECKTGDQEWAVVTRRYGRTSLAACRAAESAAFEIADRLGGVVGGFCRPYLGVACDDCGVQTPDAAPAPIADPSADADHADPDNADPDATEPDESPQ